MHSLQKQFHEFVSSKELLKENDTVLIGLSGGLDSMVLADLFLKSPWNVAVAHCNFQLRGDDSDGDEQFVRDWAATHGVPIHVKRVELEKGSVQLHARNARYRWFETLCESNNYSKVAVAHHLNDALETSLINLARGTGIKGIAGIKAKSEGIIRPLLFATKDELLDYAEVNQISWREDVTNSGNDYDRNFIRHEVIPKLEKLNPSLIQTFAKTHERLDLTNTFVQQHVEDSMNRYIVDEGDMLRFNLEWLETVFSEVIFHEILSEFGFNYATSQDVLKAVDHPGKSFESTDWNCIIDRGCLFLTPKSDMDDNVLEINQVGKIDQDGFHLSITEVSKNDVDFTADNTTICIDAEKVQFPFIIRKWRHGDRFQPLGMASGTKKISDLLIDRKVPLAQKPSVRVLLSNDEIVWVIGHQLSDLFKITESTQRCYKLEVVN